MTKELGSEITICLVDGEVIPCDQLAKARKHKMTFDQVAKAKRD